MLEHEGGVAGEDVGTAPAATSEHTTCYNSDDPAGLSDFGADAAVTAVVTGAEDTPHKT